MVYARIKTSQFFDLIKTEVEARDWIWRSRFGGKDFVCPECGHEKYWQHKARCEIRECQSCQHRLRVRAGTLFEKSRIPLLVWLRAIYFVMQGKRGISALELKRVLSMKSYGTTWTILHKIRAALKERDDVYKLKDIIELDGASFGKRHTGNQADVLVAIETKDFFDEKGKPKSRAGFAKVVVAPENAQSAQAFVDAAIKPDSMVNTDGAPALIDLKGVDHDYQVMNNEPEKLDHWLPWVHKFISNAKAWIIGTHHGVESQYLANYLAEYTYRFNRRHDPDSLFHRALTACAVAKPKTARALFG